ncbi:hypothetical protein HJC10_09685 [Corallococcus exiguus]|nr:hypothetical protein [Corallococcus exiguus]
MKYAMLAVEGPTDQAVVGQSLKLLGFKRFGGQIEDLDGFWTPLIPRYPSQTGNLYERLPMPSIFEDGTTSLAIYTGGGSDLIRQVSALLLNHDLQERLAAFGVIADADKQAPSDVARKYQQGFRPLFPDFPTTPGKLTHGAPKTGIFVLPDNNQQGVVEHLIIEAGEAVYETLLQRARAYVDGFDDTERRAAKWKPFSPEKAVIAAVASLLKPGSTNTVTLTDNLWISEQTRARAMLAGLIDFLVGLLGGQEVALGG